MKILCYYTPDKIYTPLAQKVEKDLINLNLDYTILPVNLDGKWVVKAKYRPTFILQMMELYTTCDSFLSIDADCRIYSDPIINLEKDIAMYYYKNKEYAAGTMYIKNNNICKNIMQEWRYRCDTDIRRSSLLLTDIIKEQNIDVQHLEPQYCKIFDLMKHVKDPIIEHFQASRKAKK